MKNTKTTFFEFVINADTKLSHNGGERYGNVALFRRARIVGSDGNTIEIPCISGNAIRGSMRDFCALEFMKALQRANGSETKVSADVFHLMFSGGALKEANSAGDIDLAKKMRENLPVVSIFGGAYGNVIYPGKIQVGFMIPIVKQTLHLIPEFAREAYGGNEPPGVFDIIGLDMYTRKNDASDSSKSVYIDKEAGDVDSNQMIYHIDSIVAGTKFYWWLNAIDLIDEEEAILNFVVRNLPNIPIGGKRAVGYGRVSIQTLNASLMTSRGLDHLEKFEFEGTDAFDAIRNRSKEITDFLSGV